MNQRLLAKLVLFISACLVGARAADRSSLLQSCFPSNCANQATVWADLKNQRQPCLSVSKIWWPERNSSFPVTLVTQLSTDRLKALQAQCATWAGPLAAAVYIQLMEGDFIKDGSSTSNNSRRALSTQAQNKLADAQKQLDEVVEQSENEGKCQLRLMLTYEIIAEGQATALYPVNHLRNYARLLADTEMIANIDVDMLPSATVTQDLLKPHVMDMYTNGCANNSVYVIAAFETFCGGGEYADKLALGDKSMALSAVAEGCLRQFRFARKRSLHASTNYSTWMSLQPGAPPYNIKYRSSYEPWFISSRNTTSWFDVRYRGWGRNKIMQVAHMAARGFNFFVHPTGFLVHRPHESSDARGQFMHDMKHKNESEQSETNLFVFIEDQYYKHKAQLTSGRYTLAVDEVLTSCLQKLPWWAGYGELQHQERIIASKSKKSSKKHSGSDDEDDEDEEEEDHEGGKRSREKRQLRGGSRRLL